MQKKNVLLVIPRYYTYGQAGHYVMPLGILYVSSFLKNSNVANVFTLNLNHIEGEEFDILSYYITEKSIDILGVGGLSGEYHDLARMARYARMIKPELSIVIGGGIMTADPEATMRAIPQVDFGIVGEGEVSVTELVEALTMGVSSFDQISGLIYRSGDGFINTARRKELIDLDCLPFPDYEGFNYGDYLRNNPDLSDEGKKYSQVSVVGGRSCKYNCTFCFHPSGTTYRQRTLDSIFSEIDYLVAHYDISYIALREELFATDNQRVEEFCSRIQSYDVDWSIQLRIDNVNQKLVDTLKETRCRYVFVGVESASDRILHSMRKGITLAQIETALEMLKEAGLNSRSGVIFGDAAETYETAMFTLEWFRLHRHKYRLFADMIISFPGSALYKRACREGLIPDPVQFLVDGCPIVNVSKMSDDEFREIVHQVELINGRQYIVMNYRYNEYGF